MQLDTSRFLSDRLIFNDALESKFQVADGFWNWFQRIISWIFIPTAYTEENRRTIQCFERYLVETIGSERLQRISSRYQLNWAEMERSGNPLLSRDVAKIAIGCKNITVEDINEYIQRNQADPRFAGKNNFSELDGSTLNEVRNTLAGRFDRMWQVAQITDRITGRPTQWLSRFFYDPFLADRERLQVMEDHPDDTFIDFMHNMVARVIKREMDVGTLIPAPSKEDGTPEYYYISGKLVTGKGMVSYILHPASMDSELEPLRLFRGTSPRNSELDALSTMITDLESDLGRSAYESGRIFDQVIDDWLGTPAVEGGHSMGSTIVQHRLVEKDHIKKAYLFCGPGVTEAEAEQFNQKNPDVHLYIRVAHNDIWHKLGAIHLGYAAPEKVNVDFVRYHPLGNHDHDPHVSVWGRMPEHFEIEEGITPEERDAALDHRNFTCELYRATVGPIAAYLLSWMRDLVRFFFSSRIAVENGLKIGHMQGPVWRVEHFRAV